MIKNVIILIQAIVIIFNLQIANRNKTIVNRGPALAPLTSYTDLVQELKDLRQYNFSICFYGVDVRGQDEYCWAYNVLDVALHNRTEEIR